MMQELKKIQINVFGQSYIILSDESEQEINVAANLVDSLMKESANKSVGIPDMNKIAVFVALKIAKKVIDLESEKVKWKEAQSSLIKLIDEQ